MHSPLNVKLRMIIHLQFLIKLFTEIYLIGCKTVAVRLIKV